QFGLTMHEGAAILGEVPVYSDGSWEAKVPPYLPYHLQPLDEFGLAIRNQLLWIQASPGETRRCGGCHASRSDNILPRMGATTLAQQAGPVDLTGTIADRTEFPWFNSAVESEISPGYKNVQDLFNAKCVSCHSGGANDPFKDRSYEVVTTLEDGTELMQEIPYLDLSDAPIQAYYEREVVTYPASYVSLLYPSAMMGDSVATGDVAPEWISPGSARGSRLIAKVNAESESTAGKFAWETAAHPEDVGEAPLTREERMLLIRMADLGGQYWSRRNVEGAADWNSATEYP
ncbi:MAG: c-type cytochrome, partial [Myxococcales bacterium]|nr:c-type cytochrome [Myxococcales bacterium]